LASLGQAAAHAFDLLREGMEQLPERLAPGDDPIEAGLVIRRLAVEHPALFHIVFQNRADPYMRSEPTVHTASMRALAILKDRVARLGTAGLLPGLTTDEATLYFRPQCDGLAGLELRRRHPGRRG
jgi:hypothetical protein